MSEVLERIGELALDKRNCVGVHKLAASAQPE
jgi:hypothetical protein